VRNFNFCSNLAEKTPVVREIVVHLFEFLAHNKLKSPTLDVCCHVRDVCGSKRFCITPDFIRLPPRSRPELRSSGLLRSE